MQGQSSRRQVGWQGRPFQVKWQQQQLLLLLLLLLLLTTEPCCDQRCLKAL
jgi:hypothetical protein